MGVWFQPKNTPLVLTLPPPMHCHQHNHKHPSNLHALPASWPSGKCTCECTLHPPIKQAQLHTSHASHLLHFPLIGTLPHTPSTLSLTLPLHPLPHSPLTHHQQRDSTKLTELHQQCLVLPGVAPVTCICPPLPCDEQSTSCWSLCTRQRKQEHPHIRCLTRPCQNVAFHAKDQLTALCPRSTRCAQSVAIESMARQFLEWPMSQSTCHFVKLTH